MHVCVYVFLHMFTITSSHQYKSYVDFNYINYSCQYLLAALWLIEVQLQSVKLPFLFINLNEDFLWVELQWRLQLESDSSN